MGLAEHREAAPKRLHAAVLTISDTRTLVDDSGGAYLVSAFEAAGHEVAWRRICRDDADEIAHAVRDAVDAQAVDLIVTTGGTGIAPRDVTAPTLEALFDSTIPGFGELFRWLSYAEIGSAAILSRATAGLLAGKIVIALPGSPRALQLAMEKIVLPEAAHLVAQAARRRA
ncbi:MAG: molybdenum cofactor biosynthesis protein B [Planctomycetota bacterium]